jgi:hypothetical protein
MTGAAHRARQWRPRRECADVPGVERVAVGGTDPFDVLAIAIAAGDGLHHDHVFGAGEGDRMLRQQTGLGAREEVLLQARSRQDHVDVHPRRPMNRRKHARGLDKGVIDVGELEAVPSQGGL